MLPSGVCDSCIKHALSAIKFVNFCKRSEQQWSIVTEYLKNLRKTEDKRAYYVIFKGTSQPRLLMDKLTNGSNVAVAARRVRSRLTQQAYGIKKAKRFQMMKMSQIVTDVKNKKFWCPDCETFFSCRQQIDHHLRQSRKKCCRSCETVLPYAELYKHSLTHNIPVYKCDICSKVFYRRSALEAHSLVHINYTRNYVCEVCRYSFPTFDELNDHATYAHVIISCEKCSKVFNNTKCHTKHTVKCCEPNSINDKTNYLKCPDCDTYFDTLAELNTHLFENGFKMCTFENCIEIVAVGEFEDHLKEHDHKNVVCTECLEGFESMAGYEAHLKLHATGDRKCKVCKSLFKSPIDLLLHMQDHHLQYCPSCSRIFTNNKCYAKHIKICSGQQEFSDDGVVCPYCDVKFMSFYYLNLHFRESRFRVCWVCHSIVSISELKRHMSEHDVDIYNCKACDECFGSSKKLETHLKVHKPRPYVCVECNHTFHNSQALTSHTRSHEATICDCLLRFENRRCYWNHKKKCKQISIENEGRYICDYCNGEYRLKANLVAHIRVKHMDSPQVQCATCGKRFFSKFSLSEHENTHNRVYRYTCGICSLKMSTRRGYQRHMQAHTGDKPHSCPHCSMTFSTMYQKTHHIMYKHTDSAVVYQCEFCPSRKYSQLQNLHKHLREKHNMSPEHQDDDEIEYIKEEIIV